MNKLKLRNLSLISTLSFQKRYYNSLIKYESNFGAPFVTVDKVLYHSPKPFSQINYSIRNFATANPETDETTNTSRADATGDKSLEGRYATALINVAKSTGKLETVYSNLSGFEKAVSSSSALNSYLLSPHMTFTEVNKQDLLQILEKDFQWDTLSTNFIALLITSKRLYLYKGIFKIIEKLYRIHKGLKYCQVTTSKDLSTVKKNQVVNAIQKRVGNNFELLIDFITNPNIMGGIMVSLDDQVLDFTVSSRLERLQLELLEPVLISS